MAVAVVRGSPACDPQEFPTRLLLGDGSQVLVRSVLPSDERAVAHFFSSLSRESLRLRFMACMSRVPPELVHELVHVDPEREVALVASLPGPRGERLVGMASYHLDTLVNRAEVAFVVADELQNHGIGTCFLRSLIQIAADKGVDGLDGETFQDNRAMRGLLTKSGRHVRTDFTHGLLLFHIDLVQPTLGIRRARS